MWALVLGPPPFLPTCRDPEIQELEYQPLNPRKGPCHEQPLWARPGPSMVEMNSVLLFPQASLGQEMVLPHCPQCPAECLLSPPPGLELPEDSFPPIRL